MRLGLAVLACCIMALVGVVGLNAAGDIRLVDAVKNRDKAAVRSFLKQRVDVNAPDVDGMTALRPIGTA